jgi:ABC-type multidrug transport system ATPase subunit
MIVAENVQMHFRRGLFGGHVHALNGLSLEVREGDFFALVGQNGAGKSTAMYCFLGLLRPTSGKIEVMGRAPGLGSPLNAQVAYLPEEPHYHLYLTVEEATRYYASLYGRRVSDQRIHDALDRVGLGQFRSLPLSKCSKGMKQKVGIAQCLIHETRLLYLDEPTRGLDPLAVRDFRETLRQIHQRGATIVMNSHVLSEIEMLANRVAIIERGVVVAQDDLSNLLTLNRELYSVAFEANGNVPNYLTSVERAGPIVKGSIPKERLYDFMDYTRAAGVLVHECSLKRISLEDSFFNIVRGGAPAGPTPLVISKAGIPQGLLPAEPGGDS